MPTSKSISARALIVNALADTPCLLQGLSDCDDTKAVLSALAAQPEVVDIGAAGTAMRFLTAYYSTREGEEHLITGTERMKHRPIGILVDALRQLGADISYAGETGFPPLRIRGRKLQGGAVSVEAGVSSQYISALMMLGPTLAEGLRLELVGEVASRPYILMTLQLMRLFGAEAEFTGQTITVQPGNYGRTQPYAVEPDWSAASYWYELVALSPDADARVALPGLTSQSLQGDSICADYFLHLGVQTDYTPEGAILTKAPTQTTAGDADAVLSLDFADCPDLAQTFVVTAALLHRSFRFTGLQSLRIKETDRMAALINELAKLGYGIVAEDSGTLSFDALQPLSPSRGAADIAIATYEDHRMAMAFAPAAYQFPGLCIEHPEVVSKSYPAYWQDLPLY